MAGTKVGALKAKQKIMDRYGDDWYSKIGELGGRAMVPKGFALNPQLAVEAGRKGGTISRRGPAKKSMVRKVNDGESLAEGNNQFRGEDK